MPPSLRFTSVLLMAGATAGSAFASTGTAGSGGGASHFIVPAWTVIPFLGILLSIAICPLISARWWEHNFGQISFFWMLVTFVLMFIALPADLSFLTAYGTELFTTYEEYISFIILLGALYIIAGGILIKGSMSGKPLSNLVIMAIGALLASFLGTTGAAMVLVRPLIKSIAWRRHKRHILIFFIFLVCNIGGLLTPLGDPPLFIGFLQGVPFQWTFRLAPHWALVCLLVLGIFYLLDLWMMKKEKDIPPASLEARGIRLEGSVNLLLLGGVLGAVLFSGLVKLGSVDLHFGHLQYENLLRDLGMILLALASLALTRKAIREANNFNYHPIMEVAILFIGIFTAMIPSLMLLNARGAELGVKTPAMFFWATGALSSFLDNTPTYMAFLETAKGLLNLPVSGIIHDPAGIKILEAISVGAVFMGANTYIGNGPNFMVKSIAEQEKIPMPSFFGYMGWSVSVLIPVFIILTVVFF